MAKKKVEAETKFTKEQILTSNKYANRRDILNAILSDSEYTLSEVDFLLVEFMKGQVK